MVQLAAKQSDIIHSDEANERQVKEMHVLLHLRNTQTFPTPPRQVSPSGSVA